MSDSAPPKRTDTRQRILDSAALEFASSGYHRATIDDIAAGAGLSKGAIYWHFKSKKDLFVSVIRRDFTRFTESLREVSREGGLTTEERIERFVIASMAYDTDNPEHQRLMRQFTTLTDEELQKEFQSITGDLFRQGEEIVEPLFLKGIEEEGLAPELAGVAAPMLMALLTGLKTGRDVFFQNTALEKMASDIARVFLEGVVKRGTG